MNREWAAMMIAKELKARGARSESMDTDDGCVAAMMVAYALYKREVTESGRRNLSAVAGGVRGLRQIKAALIWLERDGD